MAYTGDLKGLDLYTVQSATQRAKDYAQDTIRRVEKCLVNDSDKARRLAARQCQWCWFRKGTSLAGQAFTEYKCRCCGETKMYPNTSTPMICDACSDATELCCRCCGDLYARVRKVAP